MPHTTDEQNPLIIIKEFADDGKLQIIHSYGGGGFKIARTVYEGHQFVFERHTVAWNIKTIDEITIEHILHMLGTAKPDLLLLGLGMAHERLPDLARDLKEHQISLEIMSTASACRTWNVLLTEGRTVAVGLMAID